MERRLLVTQSSGKRFRITVPDGSKITFGPWSPPGESKYNNYNEKALNGTLRVYETHKAGASILGVFSGVTAVRDSTLDFEEEVAQETISTVWKSDHRGYKREEEYNKEVKWLAEGEGSNRSNFPTNEEEI